MHGLYSYCKRHITNFSWWRGRHLPVEHVELFTACQEICTKMSTADTKSNKSNHEQNEKSERRFWTDSESLPHV